MENKVLKDIIDYATKKLNSAYGYCAVAEGETMARLYVCAIDKKDNDIKIHITLESE